MPLRMRRFRQYEIHREWMVYFVSIDQLGRRVALRTGSIDTSIAYRREGQATCDIFASEEAARERFERWCEGTAVENRQLVIDEVSTHLLSDDDADAGVADEALERAVLQSKLPSAAAVYADWLLARGDLRGEIAARFLQSRTAEAHALIREKLSALFGRFELDMATRLLDLQWRNGFLAHVSLGWRHQHLSVAETAGRFLALPVCRGVQGFTLEYPNDARFERPPFSQGPVIDEQLMRAVVEAPLAQQLTTVEVPGVVNVIDHLAQLPSLTRVTLSFGELHGRAALERLLRHSLMGRLSDVALRPRGPVSVEAHEAMSRALAQNASRLGEARVHVAFPVGEEVRLALGGRLAGWEDLGS